MWRQDIYVTEKLRELERGRRPRQSLPPAGPPPASPRRRLLAPLVGRAGHRIRHLGEALEAWASPATGNAQG